MPRRCTTLIPGTYRVRPISDEEIAYIAANWRTMEDRDMAEALGINVHGVTKVRYANRWLLPRRSNGGATKEPVGRPGAPRRFTDAQIAWARENAAAPGQQPTTREQVEAGLILVMRNDPSRNWKVPS